MSFFRFCLFFALLMGSWGAIELWAPESEQNELRIPQKKELARFRSPRRSPASETTTLTIDGRTYNIRKDLGVTQAPRKNSLARLGRQFIVNQSESSSAVTVLQAAKTGRYALLYPQLKVRANSDFSQILASEGFEVIEHFEEIQLYILRPRENKTLNEEINWLNSQTEVKSVKRVVVENRAGPR